MTDTNAPPDELLTPQRAAALLGITTDSIRRWANDGVLPSVRTRPDGRGHRRFRRSDIERLVQGTETGIESSAAAS